MMCSHPVSIYEVMELVEWIWTCIKISVKDKGLQSEYVF